MFPNDLFVIDAYKAKVLKISNDVSSEIFDLEKEVGIVNPKDTTPKEENPVETITGHGKKDPFAGKPGYSSITVSQDKVSLFITNRNNGYLYHYKKNVGEGKYTLFQKVKVGKQPVACCEDPNGNIYVANYGDNTVSKVEIPSYKNTSATENEDLQDKVVKNIAVAAGPKSIVSDEEGTIWVACYLSHKIDPKTGADLGGIVNKIVNTTVVDSINVGSNPAAITCDTSNTIWVANSGSNTVSRILKSKKVVDFEVGARPVALVNDSYGNVIVANYDGNTVTIIETSSKAIKEGNNITTIPVGKGPNAIDVNMDDDVYVVCGLENTIHKISGKQVVSVVEVCDSPVAFGDFSGCANYNAQNVMAKADKGTTEEKIQTALDKAKQSEDSVKEMSARVEHALEDVKAAKQAVEAKTEQITEAVTKAGNAEQKATANAESIEAIKTGKLETTVFESYKSATAEKIDAATQKATTNEENIGQIKTNKLDVAVFESYKTEADGKFATKAELAAAGTSGSGAGTGTASLTPADQAKINKIDGIETDVTNIKAVTDGLKDKTFVEESAFTAYKSEAEGKFATKDEITTSGTGNLSVADKAKINKIDDIENAANAAKAVTDTLKDKTFVEDSAFNAYKSEVETKYATKAEVTTAGTGLSSDDQAKIAKIEGIETKADDAKSVTDTLKGKTFVEESAFTAYKDNVYKNYANKQYTESAMRAFQHDLQSYQEADKETKKALQDMKAVTDSVKDKTFVEDSAFTAYKSEAEGKFATKAELTSAGTGLSSADQAKIAKIDTVESTANAAKAVTDTLSGKTFVEETTFDTYKSDADGKFATKAELTASELSSTDKSKIAKINDIEDKVNDAKAVTDNLKDKTFVESSEMFNYIRKSQYDSFYNEVHNYYVRQSYVTTEISKLDNKFATKAEVQAIHGLTEDDQTKLAKLDTINKEVDILNKLDALHIKILKLEHDSTGNTNTVYFEFDEVVNPISLPEDFDLSNGSILNSNDASSHPLKFVSLDGSKTETCSVGTFNDSTCFKLTYSITTSTSFPLGDNSFVAKVILPYNPSSSTEGVNSSVFKEVEFYIRTINDDTLREKTKSDKIQMYVASGLFPVVSKTTSDGTYEQYNGDYIPSSTKVNAESLLEFDDFMSTSRIGIKRKNFENSIDIVDQDAAITIPLNIKETINLRGRIPHNDFNTLFFILPKELTNGVESISVFMDYQRQIVHKYPEEKITKEAYKKYDVYYFISNTNIIDNLYLNIVL